MLNGSDISQSKINVSKLVMTLLTRYKLKWTLSNTGKYKTLHLYFRTSWVDSTNFFPVYRARAFQVVTLSMYTGYISSH